MTDCPACKSTDLRTEEEENDYGEYVATICNACEWRSDTPPPMVARGEPGEWRYCENCDLPIRDAELYQHWGDDIRTHVNCPTVAQA